MRVLTLGAALLLSASTAFAAAQHQHGGGHGGGHSGKHGASPGEQPYAGLESRAIKALAPSEVEDLRQGNGMGMALPAELNGYPGPRHVLDLAEELNLTRHQRHVTEQAFTQMKNHAEALGEQVIAAEQRLDALFADGRATEALVAEASAHAAALRGELRAVHLSYHLQMKALLSANQVERYNHLRGYSSH